METIYRILKIFVAIHPKRKEKHFVVRDVFLCIEDQPLKRIDAVRVAVVLASNLCLLKTQNTDSFAGEYFILTFCTDL